MTKQRKKQAEKSPEKPYRGTSAKVPAGATRKALNRPLESGGGPPGSGAGPRHAADDVGSEAESFGLMDTSRTSASPPLEEEDRLERGPPFAGRSGGAVGGTPAQGRSSEGTPRRDDPDSNGNAEGASPAPRVSPEAQSAGATIRLTGFAAIEYAEKQGLSLSKHPDSITGPRVSLSIAEAEAIADEDPELIWLDVEKQEYYSGPPSNFAPEH